MISAKIVLDSISNDGVRLTTMQLCYPRLVHSEFMTHRVFSRNASSSRAIPVAKMIKEVWSNPAMPVHWGANQSGMQAKDQLTGFKLGVAKFCWRTAAKVAAGIAWVMNKAKLHKQVANRILEPFQHIHVIVTATEWDNFFQLRNHPDAQPEIHELAVQMIDAMANSKPKLLQFGQWHLPYVTPMEHRTLPVPTLLRCSAARCARVSYLTHDGAQPVISKDLDLYDRLVGSVPLHASPVEHQSTPDHFVDGVWLAPSKHGNFKGWIQNRKLLESQLASLSV